MSYERDRHAAYMKASIYETEENVRLQKSEEKNYQIALKSFNKKYAKETLKRNNPRKNTKLISKYIIYGIYAPRNAKLLFFAIGIKRCIEREWYDMATKARLRAVEDGTIHEKNLLEYGIRFSIRKLEQSDSRVDIYVLYENLRAQYPMVENRDYLPIRAVREYT